MLKNKSLMFDNWINGDLICTNGILSKKGEIIVLKIYNTFDRVFSL
jgi:hypothetical protein